MICIPPLYSIHANASYVQHGSNDAALPDHSPTSMLYHTDTLLPTLPIDHFPPSAHKRLHLHLTVTLGILRATMEIGHEITFLVDTLLRAAGVRVHGALRHQCQFRQDRTVPSVMKSVLGSLYSDIARIDLKEKGEEEKRKRDLHAHVLHDVLQGMLLRLLEVVAAVDGIEPCV